MRPISIDPARDNAVSADLPSSGEVAASQVQSSASSAAPSAADAQSPSASKPALLEQAYTEYLRRREEGEQPGLESFCARFSSCRSSLRRLLQAYEFLNDFPDFLDGGAEAAWPQAGERRGDLTVLRELGRGSFARVYLATEESTGDRLVAVKFSMHGDAEARMMGRLSHPHIVPILSARRDESTGMTVVRMPYLGSATLEDVLDRAWPAPPSSSPETSDRPRKAALIRDVLRACAQPEDAPNPVVHPRLRTGSYADGIIHLAIQLAEALAFLHEQKVCHRDLKPSNVLLDPSGKPLLLDFNLSASEREADLQTGGTLHYMAPEQLQAYLSKNWEGLDERADLFALGVMIYELLAGDHPYGPIPAELVREPLAWFLLGRMNGRFAPLRKVCPDVARPVAAALERCLSFDPADRPASAAELAVQLRRQFSPTRRTRRWLAEHWRLALAATFVLLLCTSAAALARVKLHEREYRLGVEAYREGKYDEAEKHFERAWKANRKNASYRFALGVAQVKQSRFEEDAGEKLTEAWHNLSRGQDSTLNDLEMALKAYKCNREQLPDEAIGYYDKLLKGNYRRVMVLNNRAYSLIMRANRLIKPGQRQEVYEEALNIVAEALENLNKAAQLDPESQAVFYNRARIALFRRCAIKEAAVPIPAQALKDIDCAIQLRPVTWRLYRDAAQLYALAADDDLRRHQAPQVDILFAAAFRKRAQQRIERALVYLREAIAHGDSFASLQELDYFKVLHSHPDFATLDQVQPERSIPPFDLCLIDPVELPN